VAAFREISTLNAFFVPKGLHVKPVLTSYNHPPSTCLWKINLFLRQNKYAILGKARYMLTSYGRGFLEKPVIDFLSKIPLLLWNLQFLTVITTVNSIQYVCCTYDDAIRCLVSTASNGRIRAEGRIGKDLERRCWEVQ